MERSNGLPDIGIHQKLHVIEFVQCKISNDFAKPLLFECVFLGLINFQSLWKITWVERQEDDCRCTELSQVWIKLKSKQSKLFICQYSWQTIRSFSEICPQTDPGSPRITINYEFLIPAPPQFKFIIPQQWQHSRLDTCCDYELELQTKVPQDYTSFYNHREGPY